MRFQTVRRSRRDPNQGEIVAALRAAGVLVYDAGLVGGGFPDLVTAHPRGGVRLLEVKMPEGVRGGKSAHNQKLNPSQVAFHKKWAAYVNVVTTPQEAVDAALGVHAPF